MESKLSMDFKFMQLLKFTLPSIVMMIFTSLYTMVDGIFVSRFVGTDALSAVNIVYPVFNIVFAIGIMLATGGSAIIAKKIGEQRIVEAREDFSLLVYVGATIGILILVLGLTFAEPLAIMLGASESIFEMAVNYMKTYLMFAPLGILQLLFQYFFVTEGKPEMGLVMTIVGGVLNIILDYVFIVTFDLGIVGAGLATGIGMAVPAIIGLVYFTFSRKGNLYLVKAKFKGKVLLDSSINGSSEMVSNLALAVVTLLFNLIMMELVGEDGVAAITILLYAQFVLNAIYFGFSMGVAPVLSYNFGSENKKRIKKIYRYCMQFILGISIASALISIVLAPTIISAFAQKGTNVYDVAINGASIFCISFLFTGVNIFTSSLFTAFSNGKISALLSFMRTFVFIVSGLIILSSIFGVEGVFAAVPVAEALSIVISIYFMKKYKSVYGW